MSNINNNYGEYLSFVNTEEMGPWEIYLEQIDRVTPYLADLSRWAETLKRPKNILIVDVPIETYILAAFTYFVICSTLSVVVRKVQSNAAVIR